MTASILVPLDGSPFGEQAIPTALGVARRMNAPIELVLVQEPIVIPETIRRTLLDAGQLDEERRTAGASYLETIATRLRSEGPIPVVETLLGGPVVETLTSYIAERSPRLVVMSTHGRGGISRAWLGSVADALVRRSAAPTMLVRPREGLLEQDAPRATDLEPHFARIAVPLDGTEAAEVALGEALRVAGTERVELTLLQVVPPPITYLRPSFTPDVSAELLAQLEEDSQQYLDRIAAEFQRPNVTIRTRVFVDINAARGILAYTSGGAADLVVMTTHARRGLSRLAVGSVADKVVRGSPVPVLLVHPDSTERAEESVASPATAADVPMHAALPPL